MAQRGRGRIILHRRGGVYVYVPKEVAQDSSFAFKGGGDVSVSIQGGGLVVEPLVERAGSSEREKNYGAYRKLKDEFLARNKGKYVVIASGKVICIEDSLDSAVKMAGRRGGPVKHRILWKVGEDEVARRVKIGGTWLRRP